MSQRKIPGWILFLVAVIRLPIFFVLTFWNELCVRMWERRQAELNFREFEKMRDANNRIMMDRFRDGK